MKKVDYSLQIKGLRVAINKRLDSGSSLAVDATNACSDLLRWLEYLNRSEATGCGDELLKGIRGGLIESVACITLGLVRPAVFAMRGQIDMMFSWLFYRDHPLEWSYVTETGEGYKLKAEILEFLRRYVSNFGRRIDILDKHRMRKIEDPYRVLSAHIHGQGKFTIPSFSRFDTLVNSEARCKEAISMQAEVTEYLSDLLTARFGSKWASLPDPIIGSIKARVPSDKQPIIFG